MRSVVCQLVLAEEAGAESRLTPLSSEWARAGRAGRACAWLPWQRRCGEEPGEVAPVPAVAVQEEVGGHSRLLVRTQRAWRFSVMRSSSI